MINSTNWQGFHHIALVTRDLDATIHFYRDILGMQVGKIFPATPERGRHGFIQPGESTAWGLHFFEYPAADIFAQPGNPDPAHFIPGAMQHIAFTLPAEADGLRLREHLQAQGVAVTPVNDLGPLRNFLFTDNNQILLEAAWAK